MIRTLAQFLALLLTALALVPPTAHLFSLPNKIDLPQDAYFIAQGAYRGWALLGTVLVAAILADLELAWLMRRQIAPFIFALGGAVLLAATLAVFFVFVQPGNSATADWVVVPDNWKVLRARWEFGHALDAVITLAAFCSVALSVLTDRANRNRFVY